MGFNLKKNFLVIFDFVFNFCWLLIDCLCGICGVSWSGLVNW